MNKEKSKNIDELKKIIVISDSTIINCNKKLKILENEKKSETKQFFKDMQKFTIATIFCLIIAAIIGKVFLVLPGVLIGIGASTTIISYACERITIYFTENKTKKQLKKLQKENASQTEELQNILENNNTNKKDKNTKNTTAPKIQTASETMIDNLISELTEARKENNLKELLNNKYGISDPEIINLCNTITEEELNIQSEKKHPKTLSTKNIEKVKRELLSKKRVNH